VYAGNASVKLESTPGSDKQKISSTGDNIQQNNRQSTIHKRKLK
jgi:hypothetical protein